MKYTNFLLGAVASLSLVQATAINARAYEVAPAHLHERAPYEKPVDEPECDDEEEPIPVSSAKPSVKPAPVSSKASLPVSSKEPKPVPSKDTEPISSKKDRKGHRHPVVTKTIVIVVSTYTRKCDKPTTLVEGTVTVTVTEPTTVTFSKGPYTRTKYELSCYTTTTDYYYEEDCGCGGWPYETDKGYKPVPEPSVKPVPVKPSGSVVPKPSVPVSAKNLPVPTTSPKAPVFISGASHNHAGLIALVAGVVAAVMVL